MPRKTVPKTRKSDMDMRAPVEVADDTMQSGSSYESSQDSVVMPERHSIRRQKGPSWLLVTLACLALLGAFYFYREWSMLRQTPESVNEEKTLEIVQKVSQLIDLPQDEVPVLAAVTDIESLAGQPFFANAKEGHIVLYYTVARKAYLYDPEDDILVEVATLGEGSQI